MVLRHVTEQGTTPCLSSLFVPVILLIVAAIIIVVPVVFVVLIVLIVAILVPVVIFQTLSPPRALLFKKPVRIIPYI
jgi:Flp pilus assembly protein TadB